MNDLSGQEDTFKAHKAARGLATSRICACMTAPRRRAALSTELNMVRKVSRVQFAQREGEAGTWPPSLCMSGCNLGDTERSLLASLREEEPARLPG